MELTELRAAVDAAHALLAAGLPAWGDPRPTAAGPLEHDSAQVTDPARYAVVTARARAWAHVLVDLGLADVADPATAQWEPPGPVGAIGSVIVLRPAAGDTIPMLLGFGAWTEAADIPVVVGAGDPAGIVAQVPYCLCDACDEGSDPLLAELDKAVISVIRGRPRRGGLLGEPWF